jgi:hypothetical protein
VPLYTLEPLAVHSQYTIHHVKTKTKGWTVGPHDFVGDGVVVAKGSSLYVSFHPFGCV